MSDKVSGDQDADASSDVQHAVARSNIQDDDAPSNIQDVDASSNIQDGDDGSSNVQDIDGSHSQSTGEKDAKDFDADAWIKQPYHDNDATDSLIAMLNQCNMLKSLQIYNQYKSTSCLLNCDEKWRKGMNQEQKIELCSPWTGYFNNAALRVLDINREEMQKIPLLMTEEPENFDPESNPTLAMLQSLKYENDEDPPEVKAENYKVDGNYHFKYKRYQQAIIAYTEGIKQDCNDNELNAQLYNNRGAAHSYLGNSRSALNDAIEAKKLSPTYVKAYIRGAAACTELRLYDEVESDNKKLKELKLKAIKNQKIDARNKRKQDLTSKKEENSIRNLMQIMKERGIILDGLKSYNDIDTMKLPDIKAIITPPEPMDTSAIPYLDEDMVIHWPMLFMYPEYRQTDFIKSADENHRFMDHLIVMFDNDEPLPWDKENKYNLKRLEIYFEDKDTARLHRINVHQTLKEILIDKRHVA